MNFTDKVVCVTGAGGSIGSEICKQLIAQGVKQLRLVCLTEGALYNLQKILPKTEQVVPVLGSVLDHDLMLETFEGCDVVIHAAAHKHVPICEAHPLEAIRTNVEGTYSVSLAAFIKKVPTFLLISSDKAVKPTSIMGATKRAAELIVRSAGGGQDSTKFLVVRFGNVLDSAGSVLPFWREQIAKGGPLTLTDPNCERYFMSIPNAVELVLAVLDMPKGRPYLFNMGPRIKMGMMAERLMMDAGRIVPIEVIGLRPGEKLVEELYNGGEIHSTSHPDVLQVGDDGPKNMHLNGMYHLFDLVRQRQATQAVKLLWGLIS